MPRDRNEPFAVGHHNVLALPCDPESLFFERFYGRQMIYTWDLRQLDRDLHFTDVGIFQLFIKNSEILFDGVLDVL